MRLQRENDTLHFALNTLESRLLAHVFEGLAERYRLKPGDVDPKTASVWYSTRGCLSAKLSDQETRDWIDQIHALKSTSLERLESWAKQLESSPSSLRVQVRDASVFITAVNDHRLAAAAFHDVGQAEMDIQSPLELVRLPPNQQEALLEIHLLAWIIEETLRTLQDWHTPEASA
jgi:hypothetical protein